MIPWVLLLLQASPVERWLAEPDAAARARIRSEIKGGPAEVEAELRKPPPRPAPEVKGQVVRRTVKARHEAGTDFEYALWVPADADPAVPGRLIVSLHGQGGNGPAFMSNWLGDVQRAPNTYLLCPTAKRGGWGRSLLGHRHVLDALQDVRDRYAIDPDRIFLDGTSMGGNGSFEFVCLYPDLFAGAAPRSGGPLFRTVKKGSAEVEPEHLAMLLATPVYWVVGAKDPKLPYAWVKSAKARLDTLKAPLTYVEYPEGGHDWFPQENPKVLAWMSERKRDAYPARVGLESQERLFARAYWLEISGWKGKELIQRNFMDFDQKPIEMRPAFVEMAQAVAELVKDQNLVRIEASGPIKELKIHLHPSLLDLSKPVKVSVNGKTSTPTATTSVDALLESARRDRGLLYWGSVKVTLP